jgi:deazaflavin-dependent oxidoreductase (nitroreductase family)
MINFEPRRPGPVRRIIQQAVTVIPMSWLPSRMLPRIDRSFYRLSRGRITLSAWISGPPIIMLTTTGARTGEPRAVPVLGLPDGDHLVLIASNFGQASNPGWYHNLRAHPNAVVTWNGSAVEVRARELRGAERQQCVDRSLEAYPWWQQYHHAAPRQIPVIMLEPLLSRSVELS